MQRLLLFVVSAIVGLTVSAPAWAQGDPVASTGYIEICKTASATPGIAGASFGFTVPDAVDAANAHVIVRAGECSPAIAVSGVAGEGGTFDTTVAEDSAPWFAISAIQQTTNYNGASGSVPTSTTTFPVLAGGTIAQETRIDYTNVLVTGFLEVCKSPATNSGLSSGQFSFRLQSGWNPIDQTYAFDSTIAVGLNQCSAPIAVPAGAATVTETGQGVFITDVTATSGGSTTHPAISDNGVTVGVAASTTAGVETQVTFFDALSNLKICKTAGSNGLGTYTGASATFALTGVAGAASVTVPTGSCVQIAGAVTPGSTIGVAETAQVGSQVSAITLNGGSFGAADTVNLAAGSVSFRAANGANIVTFTNVPAPAVFLKVCKAGGAPNATVNFTIGGVATGINIPSDGGTACTQPVSYPYGSTVTITETPPAGSAVADISLSGNGVFKARDIPGGTANVLLGTYGRGSDYIAAVTFTNGAAVPPPPPPPSPGASAITTTPTPTPTTTVVSPTTTPTTPVTPVKPISKTIVAKVVKVKLVKAAIAGRYVTVQVTSNAAKAKVQINFLGKGHKVLKTTIRSIPTNKLVRIGGLTIPKLALGVSAGIAH
jgi:hypothetical protein